MATDSLLFSPIRLGDLTLPHRLWVAPMCQFSAEDGVPNGWHRAHLGSFAIGRAGLVMTEATAISPEGRITPGCTGIWSTAQVEAWKDITEFVHAQGVAIGIQLSHAGRKASTCAPWQGDGRSYLPESDGGWQTVGPSRLPYGSLPEPHALSRQEIADVVQDFTDAARRSVDAGFDLIEIHAAHGYLIHEFLSPLSNERDDEYGTDDDGRARLLMEIVDAVRAALPEGFPIVVRLSATDWVPGGLDVPATSRIVAALESRGVHLVSISSGGNDPRQDIPVGPGYQVPLSEGVRENAGIPVGVAGLISSAEQAEGVLSAGHADVVYIGRQFLRESTFALRAAAELGARLEWPWQYGSAKYAGNIP